MKHISLFLLQTFVLTFIFLPIVITRFIWTFKWNDNFDGLPSGVFYQYKRCYKSMIGGSSPTTF